MKIMSIGEYTAWKQAFDTMQTQLGPDFVREVFGLPPLLPLRVCWRCEKNDEPEGALSVVSEKGLSGIARDCRMDFIIREAEVGGSASVELTMTYTPSSPIALLAVPALILDNAFALKVLLPRVIAREREK